MKMYQINPYIFYGDSESNSNLTFYLIPVIKVWCRLPYSTRLLIFFLDDLFVKCQELFVLCVKIAYFRLQNGHSAREMPTIFP